MKGKRPNDPRMPLYWQLLGFSEDEAIQRSNLERRKCSPRCLEYWIKRGFDENEAKNKVKEVQNNGKYNVGSKRTEEQKVNMKKAQQKINTLEHWVEKYGKEIGKEKFLEFKDKKAKTGKSLKNIRLKKNPNTFIENSIRRPEYWIKMGYSHEEAKIIVSKRQSRGVDFYINKYGYDEGIKRWEEKNNKWFNSFYNSNKNLEEINEKRKLNAHVGYYNENTISNIKNLNFYLIVLVDDNNHMLMKYGLTKHDSITKRWSTSLNYNLFLFKSMEASRAVELENKFHQIFKNSYTPSIIKTTECFEYNTGNLKKALGILEEFKND